MEDIKIGRRLRAIRHHLNLRQRDVGDRSRTSQTAVSRAERGRIGAMPLGTLRSIATALEAEIVVVVRWRGADLDRLLDEDHSSIGGSVSRRMGSSGWELKPEVTYSVYGERGSIDLLAWHAATRTLLVIEIKTDLVSVEETLRRHDAKVRLAAGIAQDLFGWEARTIARLLVLPDDTTTRRRVARHDSILRRAYPTRGPELKRWLEAPTATDAPLAGLLFTPATDGSRGPRRRAGRKRVHRRRGSQGSAARAMGRPAGAIATQTRPSS